jgi:hypothetical protein
MAIEAGEDISIRVRFERDASAQPGENGWWRDPPPCLFFGVAQAGMTSGVWKERRKFAFR